MAHFYPVFLPPGVQTEDIDGTNSASAYCGHFTDVRLTGSTGGGNDVNGYLGPAVGATMAPHSSETITFHVTLARNVPVSKTVPLVAFEGYLFQVNSAAGGGTTVGDTLATDIKVP